MTKRPNLAVAVPLAGILTTVGGWAVKDHLELRDRITTLESQTKGETKTDDEVMNRLRVLEIEAVRQEKVTKLWEKYGELRDRVTHLERPHD